MKRSTQLRRMVETFFFICWYCQMPIETLLLKIHFFPLLLLYSSIVSLFIKIPFRPSVFAFCAVYNLSMDQKNNNNKSERCVESLTKSITFPTVHPPAMEIPAKNTIGLSIKKSNFCFQCKRKTVISPPIFTLFHFFCSSHKDRTKDLLLAKNQNSNKIFRLTITGNLKMVVISFVCLLPVRPSALQHGGFVPREWLAAEGPLHSIIFWEIALLPLAANPTFFLSRKLVLTLG